MPRAIRSKLSQKRDGRKKWYRSRTSLQNRVDSRSTQQAVISQTTFNERIRAIPSMDLGALPLVIDEARLGDNVAVQSTVIEACLQRILHHTAPESLHAPHPEQVRALRRLIFGKGDTLLIARTGFGKSIIFHAFSILTGKITLQIIPLSKLGDEQLDDIRKLNGSNPCLITFENKRQEKDLIANVKRGIYTHVLLGPEQASSKAFRTALKSVELQARIGLVAIDECHLVKQWKDFRQEFTMLGELRVILHQDVVWFGCSATLDDEAERLVLANAGFRSVGHHMYQTEVIRTSIDRPDVAICVRPLPRGKTDSFEALYFLLDNCISLDGTATPENIPKTIVFIDGRGAIRRAAMYLHNALLKKTSDGPSGKQYTTDSNNKACCVSMVIEEFTAHVSLYDRDMRYNEFKMSSSVIRIMLATTSLGMGINVSDVDRVVLWKFPIGKDLGDYWQRLGRGGRGRNRTSKAYIFLPYWAFDTEGIDRPGQSVPPPRAKSRYSRNQLPADRVTSRSRLNQSYTPGDLSDAESVCSRVSTSSRAPVIDAVTSLRYWTKTESSSRAKLSTEWKEMINDSCHRRAFLTYLGEKKLPQNSIRTPLEKSQCCSRCNPMLFPPFTQAPEIAKQVTRPRTGTRAGFALTIIDEWTAIQAEALYSNVNRRFPMPSSAYMATECRWQLAYLYLKDKPSFWDTLTLEVLYTEAPLLLAWPHRETAGEVLLEQLQHITSNVDRMCLERTVQKRNAKDRKTQQHEPVLDVLHSAEDYVTSVRRRDDTLASQVARREALKKAHINGAILTPVSNILSQSRRGVNDHISTPSSPHLVLPEVSQGASEPTSTACNRKRRNSLIPQTRSKRLPLAERDLNTGMGLTFTPTSRSGRVKSLTTKGRENYCMQI